ncbi:condensin-2 complex subunit G2 isoform X2 [Corythoichthys intestinalis]|uniref:condensin-2 complex subunit G2 isoform X2 n=1 Tax=Corythoichthys intestinalis TaxID=161448 RepID=UPI0025A63726|nr:condensin-2 complex subunit G2 isoform X2 [Corythoichthys intestinalis]
MSKREAFLESVCKENVDDFLQFVQLHKVRTDPFDVEEVMQELSRDQREGLWGKLASLLQVVLLEVPPEQWEDAMDVESALNPKCVMAVVAGVTLVATVSLKILQDGDNYDGLLNIIHQLHDVLMSLPVTEDNVLLHIQMLCEAWWKKGLKDKNKFGHTAFVIALKKSFVLKKSGTEVQRMWSLHKVLLNVDYTSESGKHLGEQLVQCFLCPSFLRNEDGKRFMVFLFSWHVDFISLIHGTIKNKMQFFNKVTVSHVAEIYFRAWKKASGNFIERIENDCIQDFMKCAILLNRSSPVLRKVQQIIFYFHKKKIYPAVEKMLNVLYKPILWKHLSVPNFEVRVNATMLFTDAFPIIDPDQKIESALQKQLDMLMVLLFDENPSVRCNAILGVCKILARCWEVLPAVVIVDFLKKFKELASDCSSDEVRCTVFMHLCLVLDNVLSHPVLEKLIPKFKNSLHDSSEKVRVAFVDMLLKLKAVRAAKFWEVCSLDHLVVRLASDRAPVSKRLAELLFDTFIPTDATSSEWCSRCITLIEMSPIAARKFYMYADMHTTPDNMVKLILAIRRILNKCIQSNGDNTGINDSDKENSIPEGESPLQLEKDVVASLLEVVAVLWKSVDRALQQNEETQKHVYAKFGGVMSKYFIAFTDERCQEPLMQLASFMPTKAVATFSYSVLSRLRKMEPTASPSLYGQLLDCMCSWGKTASVLELINEWLSESLPDEQGENAKRKVTIQVTAEAKPHLALAYLDYLLLDRSARNKVLALSQGPLKRLHVLLGNWKSRLYSHLNSPFADAAGVDIALKAFAFHGRLSTHLQHDLSDGREYLLSLEGTAVWVGEKVLPFLADGRQGDGDEEVDQARALAAEIIKTFLTVCRDVVLCLNDDNFRGHVLHLCSLVVLSESGYLCFPAVLMVLKELTASYSMNGNKPEGDEQDAATQCLAVVANIFQKIMELLARRLKKQPEEAKQMCQSALSGLDDFLLMAQACDLSGVFDTLFAIIIVEIRYALTKMTHPEEVITPKTEEDMPPLSGNLLSVILKSALVTRALLAEVVRSLDSDAFNTLTELAAVVHILAVLKHGGQSNECLKRAALTLQQQISTHANTDNDIQGVIYQLSMTTLDEILAQWAD